MLQQSGIEGINDAVRHLTATTQHNAALAEQSANAASLLKQQADRLAASVRFSEFGVVISIVPDLGQLKDNPRR